MKTKMKFSAFAAGLAVSVSLANAYVGNVAHYTVSIVQMNHQALLSNPRALSVKAPLSLCSPAKDPAAPSAAPATPSSLSKEVTQNPAHSNENPGCGTKISMYNPATGQIT